MDRILATHTGSLIRPPELLAFLAAKERGQETDEDAYQRTLRDAVAEVVRHQVEVGIDVPDDGEMGKASWITYLYERVSGLEVRPVELEGGTMYPPSRDRQAFPGAYAVMDALENVSVNESNAAASSAMPDEEAAASGQGVAWVCTGPLTYDRAAVDRDIANLQAALAGPRTTSSTRSFPLSRPPAPTGSRTSTTPARRSSCSRWPTLCARSTGRSSTPACWCRSTTR